MKLLLHDTGTARLNFLTFLYSCSPTILEEFRTDLCPDTLVLLLVVVFPPSVAHFRFIVMADVSSEVRRGKKRREPVAK
jgi:hypothetical protein